MKNNKQKWSLRKSCQNEKHGGKFNELLKRLEANPLKLKDLEISYYKDTDEKNVAQ